MKRTLWKWLLGLGACLIVAGVAFAQVSAHFDLSWHLLSSGGGSRSSTAYHLDDSLGQTDGVVTLNGTLGQTAIGWSAASRGSLGAGFWYGLGKGIYTVYLPLVLRNYD